MKDRYLFYLKIDKLLKNLEFFLRFWTPEIFDPKIFDP